MRSVNSSELSIRIKDDDIVLDVGGWFSPFNRANWVIDLMPYETRGKGGSIGKDKEHFTKETWIQRDLCDRKPLPFKDKEIDFVICSQLLEDVRDPVFLCSEICRIGKRGYIEVPSRVAELSFGVECRHYAGRYHHRWLIEIKDSKLIFLFKPHFIHGRWKYHFPLSYGKRLKENERVQWFFWDGSFGFEEEKIIDYFVFEKEIEEFISSYGVYPLYKYKLERLRELIKKACKR